MGKDFVQRRLASNSMHPFLLPKKKLKNKSYIYMFATLQFSIGQLSALHKDQPPSLFLLL